MSCWAQFAGWGLCLCLSDKWRVDTCWDCDSCMHRLRRMSKTVVAQDAGLTPWLVCSTRCCAGSQGGTQGCGEAAPGLRIGTGAAVQCCLAAGHGAHEAHCCCQLHGEARNSFGPRLLIPPATSYGRTARCRDPGWRLHWNAAGLLLTVVGPVCMPCRVCCAGCVPISAWTQFRPQLGLGCVARWTPWCCAQQSCVRRSACLQRQHRTLLRLSCSHQLPPAACSCTTRLRGTSQLAAACQSRTSSSRQTTVCCSCCSASGSLSCWPLSTALSVSTWHG